MGRYKVKWTRLQTEIFRLLGDRAGQKFNLREVARVLNVSPTAVSNSLGELSKEGIISVEKSKKMNLLSIEYNREGQKAVELKRVDNLRKVYGSGIVEFLGDNFPGCAIILFGSYSRGDDIMKSDIDIAIVGTKEKNIELRKFDKWFGKEIVINFYKSWDIDKHLRNNLLNGIVIGGSVDI